MRAGADLVAFKRFCCEELTTDLGAPLEIESFQEEIVGPFLEGCRTNIAVVGKKNGKTSLVGALGLFVLCSMPDCSIAVVASARDQAQYILDQARLYIRRNPRLRERLRVVERAIHHRTLGGLLRHTRKPGDREAHAAAEAAAPRGSRREAQRVTQPYIRHRPATERAPAVDPVAE